MLRYRTMVPADEAIAHRLMGEFYATDAVSAPPPQDTVRENVAAALDESNHALRGILVLQGEGPVGYLMVTTFHSGEARGLCVMVEQLYVSPQHRGRGLGRQMMEWLRQEYPHARRFQLEVSHNNPAAVHLYEQCGYIVSQYATMYINI